MSDDAVMTAELIQGGTSATLPDEWARFAIKYYGGSPTDLHSFTIFLTWALAGISPAAYACLDPELTYSQTMALREKEIFIEDYVKSHNDKAQGVKN